MAFYAEVLKRGGWRFEPEVSLPSELPQRDADGVGAMFTEIDGVRVQFTISFGDSEQPLEKSDLYFVQIAG